MSLKLTDDDALFGYAQKQALRTAAVLSNELETVQGQLTEALGRITELENQLLEKEKKIVEWAKKREE